MVSLDATHDPKRRSWLDSANRDTDFPIQNLPFGVFRRAARDEAWRGGVAIGDAIVDLARLRDARVLAGDEAAALEAAAEAPLNRFMSLGSAAWSAARRALSRLLAASDPEMQANRAVLESLLVRQADAELTLPATVGDYTDFYTSYHHALNGGRINRLNRPLPPSFKHVPIGYHGRASTIVASGTPVRRPLVQSREGDREAPEFGPCRMLDYEGELAFHVGPGNAQGTPIPIARIHEHLLGCSILNDWSARDAQRWESFVAGPLLAKNFATSLSPWIVTLEALAPFRVPAHARPPGDPEPLPYLAARSEREQGGLDIAIEVALSTATMRAQNAPPHRVSRACFRDQYFTIGQMATHHASNGCRLRPGDIIASGTVSNEEPGSWGSLMENTRRGTVPLALPNGETRGFLADGDEVIMRARCERQGFVPIGFGECRGRIIAAPCGAEDAT